ncbi:ankyrin [Hypomontagnella submonticulosa]|nr:ankyrin [Hypomontagnella submonticulosa]
MGLLQLPNELLNLIAGHLSVKEISNSSCCCRDLYTILTPTLYRRLRNDIDLFRWAIESGNDNVIRKLLEYGTNPDLSLVGFRIGDPQDFRGNPVALQDYQMQLLLLEQQNLRRRARGDRSYSPEVRFQRLWTPLHLAARMGRSDTVNLLLDHGANIKSLSHQFCKCNNLFHSAGPIANYAIPWWMPLHTAICHKNYDTARLLITRGAPFQVATRERGSSNNYVTALHTSCQVGALDISRLILDHYRPPIDIKDHQGMSPLAWAYKARQWDTIDWLVQNGADVDAEAGRGFSLLLDACSSGHIRDARRLLELGADPCFNPGGTPLYHCCLAWDSYLPTVKPEELLELVKCLVKAGADINAKSVADDSTPLAAAASRGTFLVVEYLLRAGAIVDARNASGMTPLMMACTLESNGKGSSFRTVELLLQWGAPATTMNAAGQTALEVLCDCGRKDDKKCAIVDLLLRHGSPPNASDPKGSLIYMLFMSNDLETCAHLQKFGTRPPTEAELSRMINHAIKKNDAGALQFALQFEGATKSLHTKVRLFKAMEAGKYDVAKIIFEAGAPWANISRSGWTCLHHACRRGWLDFVRELLGKGADANHFNNRNETPLDLAIGQGNLAIFETLLDHGANPFPSYVNQFIQEPHTGALLKAIQRKHIEIVESMMRRGLWSVTPPFEQMRSMYYVCNSKPGSILVTLLDLLLRAHADPNMPLSRPGKDNCVPLQVAMERRNQDAVDLLLRYGATPL